MFCRCGGKRKCSYRSPDRDKKKENGLFANSCKSLYNVEAASSLCVDTSFMSQDFLTDFSSTGEFDAWECEVEWE